MRRIKPFDVSAKRGFALPILSASLTDFLSISRSGPVSIDGRRDPPEDVPSAPA